MNESIHAVVARFFNVPESGISDSFVLPPERLAGSISRRVLHAAIKRLAGADLPGVWTASTFGELIHGGAADTTARTPPGSMSPRAPVAVSGALGIGIDIEEVANLPWSGDPWKEAFYTENFTQAETAYATRQPDPRTTLAGLWCAKEAALKCGAEFATLRPAQIEIRHDESGRPQLEVDGSAVACEISISHAGTSAVAVCIRYPMPTHREANLQLPIIADANGGKPEADGHQSRWGSLGPILLSVAALILSVISLLRH